MEPSFATGLFPPSVSDVNEEDFNSGDIDEGLWPDPDSMGRGPSLSTFYSNHTPPTMDLPSPKNVPPHNDPDLQNETSTQAATSQVDFRVVSTVNSNQPLNSREDLVQSQGQAVPQQRQESLSFISLPSDEPRSGLASMLSNDIELSRLISYKPPSPLDQTSIGGLGTARSSLAQTSNELQLYDPSLEGDSWVASVSQEQQIVRYEQLRTGSVQEQQVVRYERPRTGSVQEQQVVRYERPRAGSVQEQQVVRYGRPRAGLVQGQQLVLYESLREDLIEESISPNLRSSSAVSTYQDL